LLSFTFTKVSETNIDPHVDVAWEHEDKVAHQYVSLTPLGVAGLHRCPQSTWDPFATQAACLHGVVTLVEVYCGDVMTGNKRKLRDACTVPVDSWQQKRKCFYLSRPFQEVQGVRRYDLSVWVGQWFA
jgi:hypothetical protein